MANAPTWYYNEFQQIGTDFENMAQVAVYDRNQTSSSIAAKQKLIAQLGMTTGDTVIDLGCGTGTFAIEAALAGAKVYAVDVSQAMLNCAQEKAKKAGVAGCIEFHRGGFLTYEHQSAPVDFIVTQSVLHHLPDFWKAIALLRMASMLRNGGVFYLWDAVFSFPLADYQTHIDAWIDRVAKPADAGWTAQDFETHVREEYTTFGWILERMLRQAGFTMEFVDYPTTEYAEYVCRKRIDCSAITTQLSQQRGASYV